VGSSVRLTRRGVVATLAATVAAGGLTSVGSAWAGAASPAAAHSRHGTSPSTACDTTWVPRAGSVIVFPQPGTKLANPKTQLTFRGVPLSRIGKITVIGSKSGTHGGHWKADSDGRGASFYPNRPFTPGERVTVHTHLGIVNGSHGNWSFVVSRPVGDVPANHIGYTTSGSGVREYQTTGIRPAAVSVADPQGVPAAPGDIFLAPKPSGGMGSGQPGPMIMTGSGKLVWFRAIGSGGEAFNFRAQTYRGKPVLTWFQGRTTGGHGRGYDVIDNEQYRKIASVHAGNGYTADLHEFTITPENTALITAYQPVEFSGGGYHGVVQDGIVQEIDIPTGNVLFEWHALDHVWLRASYLPRSTNYYDYFHVNSADLDARDDGVLISARNTDTEYFVSRYTGAVQWRIGGKNSTMGGAVRTIGQHDVAWLSPTEISIFDDGSLDSPPPTREPHSRGLIVALNCATHQASYAQTFTAPGPAVTSQGSMEPLPNGDALLGLGQSEWFYELTPSDQPVLAGRLPGYDQSYRVYDMPWAGYPTTRPAVRASSANGGLDVAVSWNGATQVVRWRLRGGSTPDPQDWTASDTVPKSNYEDHITPSWNAGYVRVQALDSAGKVIGTSAVVRVSSG
jgi:hypothetical protein